MRANDLQILHAQQNVEHQVQPSNDKNVSAKGRLIAGNSSLSKTYFK